MKRFLTSLTLAALLLAALTLGGCGKGQVAMTVNGVDIPQGVLNYYINYGKDYLASYGIDVNDPESGAQYMSLIEEQGVDIVTEIAVVRSLAKEAGLTATAEQINESLAEEKSYFTDDAAWQEWLKTYELSEADVKWILEYQLLADALYDQVNAELVLTDEQVAEAYNADPAKYDAYRFGHILIVPAEPKDDAAWAAALETAKQALQDIESGAKTFEELAAEYNPDSTKATGGDLGQLATKAASPYVEEFSQAAFALTEVGELTTEPVRTDFGYHLIKLLEKQEGMEAAREAINEEQLGEQRYNNYNEKVSAALENVSITKDYERKYAVPEAPENSDNTDNTDNTENTDNNDNSNNTNNTNNQ